MLVPAVASASEEWTGPALAAHVRDRVQVPVESVSVSGNLRIRKGDGRRHEFSIKMRTLPGFGSWTNQYQALVLGNKASHRLTIVRTPGERNRYYLEVAPDSDSQFSEPEMLADPDQAFSLSDFHASDLGFEHLYWPVQTILEKDRRKTRTCFVLESRRSESGKARVVTWIDEETGGPVAAEVYDDRGEKIREFSVGGIRRVNGKSQISEIQMRSFDTDSRSTIEFHPMDL